MRRPVFTLVAAFALAACATVQADDATGLPPALADRADMPAVIQVDPSLTAHDIVARAHEAAGGESWVHPGALFLKGYNIIRTREGGEVLWDHYAMWRVFADEKPDAHTVEGKVRIEAWTDGNLSLLLGYDGAQTYNKNGLMDDQSANAMWSANFGFGAIRNALDEGWTQMRLPDDMVDGQPAYMVELTDPSGGMTRFGIRQSDYAILYVGFDTPRGWHERRYSDFFTKPGISWVQPGRVRLFYDGVKANEAIWLDFEIGEDVPETDYAPAQAPLAPTF